LSGCGRGIAQYPQIPDKDLVYNCALEHGISFDKINEYASDESGLGMGMLRDSVTRSMDANVSTSCTVRSFSPRALRS